MKSLYKILLYAIFVAATPSLYAQTKGDSLHIYFRRGYAEIDPELRGNRETLRVLEQTLKTDSVRHIIELRLQGNTSPDGISVANKRLSAKRVSSLLEYFQGRVVIPDSLVTVRADGVDWDGLARLVENDSLCPARTEVLDILYNTPEWIYDERQRIVDGRKKRLMDLRGGIPYNYMLQEMFPDLRNVNIVLRYEDMVADSVQDESPSVGLTDSPVEEIPSETSSEQVDSLEFRPDEPSSLCTVQDSAEEECDPLHRMAIKTNLLYDAVLMPSLEVEYRIDNRWSVAVEGSVAWWSKNRSHKYYQIATIVPEGRYWFHTKKPWHGHYVGLFAGGSWYDLENGARGYKGEFFMTGVSYGYMFPIGRSLSLETGIGIGFLRTSYEEYLPVDGHYVYQQTSRTNWFGPVKLKFALVWRLWNQNKGGKR